MADMDDMLRPSQPWANGDAPNPPKRRKTTNVYVKGQAHQVLRSALIDTYIRGSQIRSRVIHLKLRRFVKPFISLGPQAHS